MDETSFWKIIARSKEAAGDAPDLQGETLRAALEELSSEEVVEFSRVFAEHVVRAYRWDLWGAAYVINGGASDDGFEYFRRWLVGQGQEVYEAALKDPESLARIAPLDGEAENEELSYIAADVLEGRGLEYQVPEVYPPGNPAGEPWDEDDLPELFPKLWAKFEE